MSSSLSYLCGYINGVSSTVYQPNGCQHIILKSWCYLLYTCTVYSSFWRSMTLQNDTPLSYYVFFFKFTDESSKEIPHEINQLEKGDEFFVRQSGQTEGKTRSCVWGNREAETVMSHVYWLNMEGNKSHLRKPWLWFVYSSASITVV